jgi:subtilisin family serine protease
MSILSPVLPPPEWMETCGEGVKILLLDTGVNVGTRAVLNRRCFTMSGLATDMLNHGTRIARIMSSNDPNEIGVAPLSHVYSAKVIEGPRPDWSAVRAGIRWGIDEKVNVACIAFASGEKDVPTLSVLHDLIRSGCLVIVAYHANMRWPGNVPGVVTAGRMADSQHVDLCFADTTTLMDAKGTPGPFTGTSCSAAFATGIAACARSFNPQLTREQFIDAFATH